MNQDILFSEIKVGSGIKLKNRIVMAPITRSMADDKLVPTQAMADYYGRRADAGLIITEATLAAQSGQGYPNTPGLYTQAQVEGWRKVTRQVHENGGKIFAQIFHAGRVSHPVYLQGAVPFAPSAVPLTGRVPRTEGLSYGTPREMNEADFRQVIQDFAVSTANAREAGFDGVEIHGANGYLLDQFLHWDTNRRTDEWGGNVESMARLLFKVLDVVSQGIPQVGLRLSPAAYISLEHDPRDKAVFDHVLEHLNRYNLAYVHTGMFEDSHIDHLGGTVTQYLSRHYRGAVIASGGYDTDRGRATLRRGDAHLISVGRPFIANPDYVEKIRSKQALKPYSAELLDTLV